MSLQLVSFEQTPTSKRVTTIENKLTRELNTIVGKIRNYINPLQPVQDIENKFKPLYEQQVYDAIRAAASDSYIAGVDYVTSLPIFKNLHSYLISEDIDTISRLADEYTARFWGRVAITTGKGKDKIFGTIPITREQGLTEPAPTFLSQRYIVEIISIGVTNTALNTATVDKMRYLTGRIQPTNINSPVSNLVQGAENPTNEDILGKIPGSSQSISTVIGLAVLSSLIGTVTKAKLIWYTSLDERVCPICKPLHGKKFELYDQNITMPPIHHRCRCRLMIMTPPQ